MEETDESVYWLEMILAAGIGVGTELKWLLAEANELSRIFNQSQLTAKANAAARAKVVEHVRQFQRQKSVNS